MSHEVNTNLLEYAETLIDMIGDSIIVDVMIKDIDHNDLEGLRAHIHDAEQHLINLENNPI